MNWKLHTFACVLFSVCEKSVHRQVVAHFLRFRAMFIEVMPWFHVYEVKRSHPQIIIYKIRRFEKIGAPISSDLSPCVNISRICSAHGFISNNTDKSL